MVKHLPLAIAGIAGLVLVAFWFLALFAAGDIGAPEIALMGLMALIIVVCLIWWVAAMVISSRR